MSIMDSLLQTSLEVEHVRGEDAGRIERHSYDVIYEELSDEGKNLIFERFYALYQKNEVILRCRCNPNASIEMVPVKVEDTHYIRTIRGKKGLHQPGCNFEGGQQSNYYANWQEDPDTGKIRVRFGDSYVVDPPKKPDLDPNGEERDGPPRFGTNTYNRITLYAFFMRLMLDAWNVSMRNYYDASRKGREVPYPNLHSVYKSIQDYWAKKIIFGKHELKTVLFWGRGDIAQAAYAIQNDLNLSLMVLMKYVEQKDLSDTTIEVKCQHMSSGKMFTLHCERSKWLNALDSLSGIGGPLLVGGWVNNTGYGRLVKFRSLALIPVSSNGVVIDSSYEREFYDRCHADLRQIVRPYNLKFFPSWQGMLPDGLFLDTPKKTIVEIFGMSENQNEYHQRKEQKIAHFSTLHEAKKKPFSFWYWEPYKGDPMPDLP
ncbi:hypothetical protein J2T17_006367 [Paenibacillus mucilaginosus]|uniref:hypothetical protein n=1 Tax=Paenibacillus mucilaginosus TaxID=61624 RepID=UPI003D1F2469